MSEIRISDKITYIECSEDPLSADIGIIRDGDVTWLYDVGNNPGAIRNLTGEYNVVLSHFHKDHTGNLEKLRIKELYVSKETLRHVSFGSIVQGDINVGNVHIFTIPSSHAKGCLGLETDGYAFVGDALYSKVSDKGYLYNPQLLKEEIAVLEKLSAPRLLVSHFSGLIRDKAEAISELKEIYALWDRKTPEILVPFET